MELGFHAQIHMLGSSALQMEVSGGKGCDVGRLHLASQVVDSSRPAAPGSPLQCGAGGV